MSPQKILIVDDEEKILKYVKIELRAADYDVVTALNGKDAIVRATKDSPDLILMDVILPDMNGAEVVKELKKNPQTDTIPIVFLTGMMTREEETEDHLGIKVDEQLYDSIAKPFESEELLAKVKEILKG